jgi:hypothetical protein
MDKNCSAARDAHDARFSSHVRITRRSASISSLTLSHLSRSAPVVTFAVGSPNGSSGLLLARLTGRGKFSVSAVMSVGSQIKDSSHASDKYQALEMKALHIQVPCGLYRNAANVTRNLVLGSNKSLLKQQSAKPAVIATSGIRPGILRV